jgi:hypothetical protein
MVVATGPHQLASVPPRSATPALARFIGAPREAIRGLRENIVLRVDLQQHRLKVDIGFLCTRGGADLFRRCASRPTEA